MIRRLPVNIYDGDGIVRHPLGLVFVLCCLCALIAGCRNQIRFKHPIPNYFRSAELSQRDVRRVVVFPPLNPTSIPQVEHALANALANELTASGFAEAIRAPYPDPCRGIVDWATIPESLLIHASQNYDADAVLIGTIGDYRPYWPARLALKLHLVDVRDTRVLATVDGVWDAGRENVAEEICEFGRRLASHKVIPHMEMVELAPRIYVQFVAHEVVRRMGNNQASTPLPWADSQAPTSNQCAAKECR